jgi:hypothetical protein
VGWRAWAVIKYRRQLRLRSVVFDTIWQPQAELLAHCNHPLSRLASSRFWPGADRHVVPAPECRCGIYASSSVDTAASYLYLYDDIRQPHLYCRAIGSVSIWGSVIEGERGWRGSFAYPERIYVPATDRYGRTMDVDAIAVGLTQYGVPIEIVDDDDPSPVARAVRSVKANRRRVGAGV